MKQVFEQSSIAGIVLSNRIIRSATHEGLGDANGHPLDGLSTLYAELAEGGVGLIITGECAVSKSGVSSGAGSLRIDSDRSIMPFRRLTSTVHALGVPIVLQLQHCGRQTSRSSTGTAPVAPSAVRDRFYGDEKPHALSEDEIYAVIESFVSAVGRALNAGFDGVQLHAAHGYLLSQFLSLHTNRRKDEWGGSLENRFRIIKEILVKSRERYGTFPVMVKLNAYDARRNGMRLSESIEIARLLEQCGCSAVEVSCGTFEDGLITIRGETIPVEAAFAFVPSYRSMHPFKKKIFRLLAPLLVKRYYPLDDYNADAAAVIKRSVAIPVIVCGGIRSLSSMSRIVGEGVADFVSLSRPLVIEPGFAADLKSGKSFKSRCISCNFCAVGLAAGPLRCWFGKIPPSYL